MELKLIPSPSPFLPSFGSLSKLFGWTSTNRGLVPHSVWPKVASGATVIVHVDLELFRAAPGYEQNITKNVTTFQK